MGSWDMAWNAVWKLENQESWWYNLVQVQRSENQGADAVRSRVWRPRNQELSRCPRAGTDGHLSSKREFALPLSFCSMASSSGSDEGYAHCWEWIFFTQLLNHMLTSSRNILTDTPRNSVSPAIWASLKPVKLTHKLSHHTPSFSMELILDLSSNLMETLFSSVFKLLPSNTFWDQSGHWQDKGVDNWLQVSLPRGCALGLEGRRPLFSASPYVHYASVYPIPIIFSPFLTDSIFFHILFFFFPDLSLFLAFMESPSNTCFLLPPDPIPTPWGQFNLLRL